MPRRPWVESLRLQPHLEVLESRQLLAANVLQGLLDQLAPDAAGAADENVAAESTKAAGMEPSGNGRPEDVPRGNGSNSNPGVEKRSDRASESLDYAPDQSFAVDENSAHGTTVGLVSTSFPNTSKPLTYSLIDGNQAGQFSIDSATGVISVAEGATLDFEAQSSYQLTVQVSNGSVSDTAEVTIDVADVNEAPTIAAAAFAVEENSSGGTLVGAVSADDPDQGAVLSYAITSGNEAGQFVIDAQTGVITVADGADLDFESTESFVLTVQVSDGLLTSSASAQIDLIDVDEAPSLPPAVDPLVLSTDVTTTLSMEATTVSLTGEWTRIDLSSSFVSPVIVGTVLQQSGDSPVVVRIRNVDSTSFEARLQNPSGDTSVVGDVFFLVVEEGSWELPDGRKIEAQLVTSDGVSHKRDWSASQMERVTTEHSFDSPVVLGQVMSNNDEDWSAFWSSDGHSNDPAEAGNIYVGKHVGEDSDTTRAAETLGVIVVEAGAGQVNGVSYSFNVGEESVVGVGDGGTEYPVGLVTPEVVVAVQAGMNGGDGGWAVVTSNAESVVVAIDEDQTADAERNHVGEYVSYAAFQTDFTYHAPLDAEMEGVVLEQDAAEDMAQAVIARFVEAGLSDTFVGELNSLEFVVTDLSSLGANVLTVSDGNVVYIDDDAGGFGWFVDASPDNDSEFTATPDGLFAEEGSDGYGAVDLMTVLANDFARELDVEAFNDVDLFRELGLGERRDDYADAVDQLLATV